MPYSSRSKSFGRFDCSHFKISPASLPSCAPASIIRNPHSAVRHFFEPSGEPAGEELAEQFAGADAGVKVAAASGAVFLRFVIAESGMVKRQLHEARKGQDAALGGFGPDDFGE